MAANAGLLRYFISLLLLVCLLSGCGPTKHDLKKVAAEKAVKALRKVEAATRVGVTLTVYRQLLIDAQVEVNAASQSLAGTNAGFRLEKAMASYVDAASFWELTHSGRTFYQDDPIGKKLIDGYAAIPDGVYGDDAGKTVNGKFVLKADAQVGVQRAWKYASIHIEKASELLEKGDLDSLRVGASPS